MVDVQDGARLPEALRAWAPPGDSAVSRVAAATVLFLSTATTARPLLCASLTTSTSRRRVPSRRRWHPPLDSCSSMARGVASPAPNALPKVSFVKVIDDPTQQAAGVADQVARSYGCMSSVMVPLWSLCG